MKLAIKIQFLKNFSLTLFLLLILQQQTSTKVSAKNVSINPRSMSNKCANNPNDHDCLQQKIEQLVDSMKPNIDRMMQFKKEHEEKMGRCEAMAMETLSRLSQPGIQRQRYNLNNRNRNRNSRNRYRYRSNTRRRQYQKRSTDEKAKAHQLVLASRNYRIKVGDEPTIECKCYEDCKGYPVCQQFYGCLRVHGQEQLYNDIRRAYRCPSYDGL